jgi:hypothetical protein
MQHADQLKIEHRGERLRLHAGVSCMQNIVCCFRTYSLGSWTMKTRAAAQAPTMPDDRLALVLMLAYVEAECRRLGADAAAQHAAMAAALVPPPAPAGASPAMH